MKKISINIMRIYFLGIFRDLIKIISRAFMQTLTVNDLLLIALYRLNNDVEKEKNLINEAIKKLQSKVNENDLQKSPSINS